MQLNNLIHFNNHIYRVLAQENEKVLLMDCIHFAMPSWVDSSLLSECKNADEAELSFIPPMESLSPDKKCIAQNRYTLISPILPVIGDKYMRSILIARIAENNGVSKQTVRRYLYLFLAYQKASALVPSDKLSKNTLSKDEKNFRWAINKFYYSPMKHTLKGTYLLMLHNRYTDNNGNLLENVPPFHRFKYFYNKTKKLQSYYIAREGYSAYKRNHRPLLGEGVSQYATNIGVGMLDSTLLDIYLVNESGQLVGRPILTACVDAFSGLCCGYSLSWEGGVFSLKRLLDNIITDKVSWCKQFGISISQEDWNCTKLPATLLTDKGKEYTSYNLEQLTDLGIKIVNLPPYRPDLKGCVEQFFNVIQNLYKPQLKGKGVIEKDFQERGAIDYRKTACLTMRELEKILLKCIIYYNTKRSINRVSFIGKTFLDNSIPPFSNAIWNYSINTMGSNLIAVSPELLHLTLLPRKQAKFTRQGLIFDKLRYYNSTGFAERYLQGGTCIVSYDPENTSSIWLLENGIYTEFTLIEQQYSNQPFETVHLRMDEAHTYINSFQQEKLQAQVALIRDIKTIAENGKIAGKCDLSSMRVTRKKEKQKKRLEMI